MDEMTFSLFSRVDRVNAVIIPQIMEINKATRASLGGILVNRGKRYIVPMDDRINQTIDPKIAPFERKYLLVVCLIK